MHLEKHEQEVEIATWLVEDGDYVEKDQPIASNASSLKSKTALV